MLITSIYCAHNMGAHCACASRSSLTVPRPCRLHLATPAPPATCDACIAGHAAAAASGSAASRFPAAFFLRFLSFARPFFLFLLLLHSKFNYRECEFLPDSESDSASHVLFQHRRLSANFQRISILFAVDLCNARPFEAHAFPSARPPIDCLPRPLSVPVARVRSVHSNNR